MIEIFPWTAATRSDKQAVVDEHVRDINGCFQQPARISTQVNNQLLHPLAVQLPQSRIDIAAGRFLEARQLQIGDAVRRINDLHLPNARNIDAAASERDTLDSALSVAN